MAFPEDRPSLIDRLTDLGDVFIQRIINGFNDNASFLPVQRNHTVPLDNMNCENFDTQFKCLQCKKGFQTRDCLDLHTKNCSSKKRRYTKKKNCLFKCPVESCQVVVSFHKQLLIHMGSFHNIETKTPEEYYFRNEEDFNTWLTNLQQEVGVWYKKLPSYYKKNCEKFTRFKCQARDAKTGVLSEQEEQRCPSLIEVIENINKSHRVTYYPAHYGHYTRPSRILVDNQNTGNQSDFHVMTDSTNSQSLATATTNPENFNSFTPQCKAPRISRCQSLNSKPTSTASSSCSISQSLVSISKNFTSTSACKASSKPSCQTSNSKPTSTASSSWVNSQSLVSVSKNFNSFTSPCKASSKPSCQTSYSKPTSTASSSCSISQSLVSISKNFTSTSPCKAPSKSNCQTSNSKPTSTASFLCANSQSLTISHSKIHEKLQSSTSKHTSKANSNSCTLEMGPLNLTVSQATPAVETTFSVKTNNQVNTSLEKCVSWVTRQEMTLGEAMTWLRYDLNDKASEYEEKRKLRYSKRISHQKWCEYHNKASSNNRELINGLQRLGENNPLIIEDANVDDFMETDGNELIIIMNTLQTKMLKDFGDRGIVCVDTILDAKEQEGLSMIGVNVLDAFGKPLPCAVCISDDDNRSVVSTFFSAIKSRTNVINASIFMCGREEHYEIWKSVMAPPDHVFFGSWLVDYKWQCIISSLELSFENKLTLYVMLRSLMNNPSELFFKLQIESLLKEVFPKYKIQPNDFEMNKAKLWANSQRRAEVRNSDAQFESLYQEFYALCAPNDKERLRKLDDLILASLDVVKKHFCERLVHIDEYWVPRLKTLNSHHLKSLECNNLSVEAEGNNFWVLNTNEGTFFLRRVSSFLCDNCKLSCSECDVCIHNMTCSCFDNLINYNLCTHLHFVSRFLSNIKKKRIEDLKDDVIRRSMRLQESFQSVNDIETLTTIQNFCIELQSLINNAKSNK